MRAEAMYRNRFARLWISFVAVTDDSIHIMSLKNSLDL